MSEEYPRKDAEHWLFLPDWLGSRIIEKWKIIVLCSKYIPISNFQFCSRLSLNSYHIILMNSFYTRILWGSASFLQFSFVQKMCYMFNIVNHKNLYTWITKATPHLVNRFKISITYVLYVTWFVFKTSQILDCFIFLDNANQMWSGYCRHWGI